MGASDPPFLYDPAPRNSQIAYPYSDFNPRAATQAHYAALADRAERQKRKAQHQQEGKPLINFNQHPDSYMIVNNPVTHFEPLPPNTKRDIVWSRWGQLLLRVVQEVGALGVLVCVICLKMDNDGPGWITRVAPAWDVVITMYAIYHLLRPAKGRTPATSSSYHFFALFMDTGLIPFYVFVALYANQNYNEQPGVDGRWTSFFTTNVATTKLIFATFIASVVLAGLHLISIALDLYLIVMFRKIARMPPDMNPLEDNLTGSIRRSRSRSQKHKYKNSEATVSSLSTDMSEKKPGYLSGSTLSVHSTAKAPEARTIPFGHSRTDSDYTYSPHNPNSARLSRQQYDQQQYDQQPHFDEISLHQGPSSGRASGQEVGAGHRSRASSVVSHAKNTSVIDFGDIPPLPRPNAGKTASFYSARPGSPHRVDTAPSSAVVKSQQKQGLLNDNWYVLDEEAMSDLGTPLRHHRQAPSYAASPTLPRVEVDRHDSFQPQPLKMNPPTPPPGEDEGEYPDPGDGDDFQRYHGEKHEPAEIGVARTATVTSNQTATSSVYSESSPSFTGGNGHPNNASPKGKFYGDLASATRGVRGAVPLGQTHFPQVDDRHVPRGMNQYGVPTPQQSRTPSPQKGRVISRTGADIADGNPYSLRDRRDVSGKIAEEGRVGASWR
ncbi:hypothetical protein DOTSEDRAFT_31855 [Lecanosticta acicola]|uniref:Uncharacterized protein n=1 Tax=Lecanosticta acicola TaxID=111012 RepID=A0AAI9ED76_9PEZI|nr:hypothetical protein DOTSEDRAFT_31855 [Lecanosticta acicola]